MRTKVQAYFHFVRSASLLIALTLSALPCHAADQAIEGAHGIIATIDPQSGRYAVQSREFNWTFTGQLGESVSNLSIKNGQDRLGAYRELRFAWRQPVPLEGSIRTYLARAVVLSPAANYMIATMHGDGITEIASGLNEGVANLPADFAHRTLMLFDIGLNAAWDGWGTALTDLQGKRRPSNDADIGLRYLGYWTDNGAAYWYTESTAF